MTAKECLVEFKKNYCKKDQESMKDPEFRCDECLFRRDNECSVNAFIGRHDNKEGK